jgi:thioredoxin-like negative regulator of GroEL
MSNITPKKTSARGTDTDAKPADLKTSVPPVKPAMDPAPPFRVPPLFRRIDWVTMLITFVLVFAGYLMTLAPDLTLEDSGELAVGSFYAGIPHPPGYPVWTLYSWLFTVLVPISNIAYRVGLSSAFAGALSCGIIALMVSRGSSMFIEGIAELKNLERKWENALCVVSGFVAGMLMGFNGFMWSQAVIVEVYTLSVLSLVGVLVSLMRWIHAPHQRRYLYLAFFLFGICFNNHQSLLVIAMGLEVAVVVAQPRLGRQFLFYSSAVYLAGVVFSSKISMLEGNPPVQFIYHLIGIAHLIGWIWLAIKTKVKGMEILRDFALLASVAFVGVLFLHATNFVTVFRRGDMVATLKTGPFILFILLTLGAISTFVYIQRQVGALGREWLQALTSGVAWLVGCSFYLYMPLAGMTNPPMQWGYPRTVTGFIHAFTRGQYERIHPTSNILLYFKQFYSTIIEGSIDEFGLILLALGCVVFFFYKKMQKRERAWFTGLIAIYIVLGPLLLFLLSPGADRQSQDLNKVFFTASHVLLSMFIGYSITLGTAALVLYYERWRRYALIGLAISSAIVLYWMMITVGEVKNPVVHYTAYFGFALTLAATALLFVSKRKAPMTGLLALFALSPFFSVLSHWEENEQHGHLFGYWFGHDMFTPPFRGPDGKLTYDKKLREEMSKKPEGKLIYPEMDRDTVLYGGTDPGRFNPTYMIFCESFIPASKKPHDPSFDRRDVYLITQNALADGTYLNYIRAHYNRSAQIDPPFFQELFRGAKELSPEFNPGNYTNIFAKLAAPLDHVFLKIGHDIEKRRRAGTSFFTEADFLDVKALAARLRPGAQQDSLSKFIFDHFSKDTQALVQNGSDENALKRALAKEFNVRLENEFDQREKMEKDLEDIEAGQFDKSKKEELKNKRVEEFRKGQHQLFDTERFKNVTLPENTRKLLDQNPASFTLIRMDRLLLEAAYPKELAKSIGGVYPDREIQSATNDDSQKSFQEYLQDAQRRLDHDRKSPNEQKQIKPGEDVRIIDNRVQVSGQVAVMAINGLLTKVIFDKNPDHEFYVEESFPLDWMYPHLTPYGIIMKINRQPVPEFTEEIVARDHQFWSDYSERLVGNWINYDTPVTNICAFAEKIYFHRDYRDFKGSPMFVRDNDAQKAFSKLRSSIAGVYAWRLLPGNTKSPAEQQRMLREAEFAFKQAYAFCPYSPEAVFRYVNLLVTLGRMDDAIQIGKTTKLLDPNNPQIDGLIDQLQNMKAQQQNMGKPRAGVDPAQLQSETDGLQKQFAADPGNAQVAGALASKYAQLNEPDKALSVADRLIESPKATAEGLLLAAQIANQLTNMTKVEVALTRLVQLSPDNPEALFDLAGIRAILAKPEALPVLREALRKNVARLEKDKKANNLYASALTDMRFAALRTNPEFQKMINDPELVPR